MNTEYGTKVFATGDIKELDRLTLLYEKIGEVELISRAARAFFDAIIALYPPSRSVLLFCGPGNNGNDGRALASLLMTAGYRITRYDLGIDDAKPLPAVAELVADTKFVEMCAAPLMIDALFGAGLNRALDGVAAEWVQWMNSVSGVRIALDIPSGWHGEENAAVDGAPIVRAHLTLTLDFPKRSFFFPESAQYVGEWQVVPLGLSPQAIAEVETPFRMVSPEKMIALLKPLPKFLHKGAAGRVRLFAGSPGMMGAAALATKAAYRTGAGWVEVLTPKSEMQLLQMMVPEAIVRDVDMNVTPDKDAKHNGGAEDVSMTFGAGPGMGVSEAAATRLKDFLKLQTQPVVLDADALNILSANPDLWLLVPKDAIITPHPGEFRRLAGGWENDHHRLQLQRSFAAQRQVIVVLKGAHTSIALPNGTVYFNVSGNPGMATAGSGDVLTGIILGLLAQGLPPQESAILGVYLHGVAGDLAAADLGQRSVMASDITNAIPKALHKMELQAKF